MKPGTDYSPTFVDAHPVYEGALSAPNPQAVPTEQV
jgi:hypothetical protein